jgi:putative endonuclease
MSKVPIRKGKYWVYIVRCKNGTYYTGYTNNLEKRIALHNSGNGAKYLRGKLPVTLVYAQEYCYYKSALNREKKIKTLNRQQKEGLVSSYEIDNRCKCS